MSGNREEERNPSTLDETPHWSEPHPSTRKRRRRRRLSPQAIRERKRQKRRRNRRSKPEDVIYLEARAEKGKKRKQETQPVRVQFGRGQLKRLVLPKVFSLLENPEDTIEFLDQLIATSASNSVRHMNFTGKDCTNIGLDALVAMSVLVMRAERQRKKTAPLTVSGTWPSDPSMQIMFRASGIPHHLGLKEADLTPEQEKLIHRCELRSGKAVPLRYAMGRQRNEATQELRKYFDNCLHSVGFSLTREGKMRLDKLISEVIGNAEEHGGPWHTIGHLQIGESGERRGICHIALFNFGNSIYRSFLDSDASPTIVGDLRSLSDMHTKRGWFRALAGTWDEETLWTLYALQERVSRFSGLPNCQTRGNGTCDIVEFFLELGNPGRMCIVSGHAYVLFDGTYNFNEIEKAGEVLKIITFNKSGTLEEPPDRTYVRRLPKPFPGTMVSIRLTLDERYLSELVGSTNDQAN